MFTDTNCREYWRDHSSSSAAKLPAGARTTRIAPRSKWNVVAPVRALMRTAFSFPLLIGQPTYRDASPSSYPARRARLRAQVATTLAISPTNGYRVRTCVGAQTSLVRASRSRCSRAARAPPCGGPKVHVQSHLRVPANLPAWESEDRRQHSLGRLSQNPLARCRITLRFSGGTRSGPPAATGC